MSTLTCRSSRPPPASDRWWNRPTSSLQSTRKQSEAKKRSKVSRKSQKAGSRKARAHPQTRLATNEQRIRSTPVCERVNAKQESQRNGNKETDVRTGASPGEQRDQDRRVPGGPHADHHSLCRRKTEHDTTRRVSLKQQQTRVDGGSMGSQGERGRKTATNKQTLRTLATDQQLAAARRKGRLGHAMLGWSWQRKRLALMMVR